MKNENDYQPLVIKRLKKEFPGGISMKNDAGYRQGYPDLIYTYGKTIHLETKRSKTASFRPNQNLYIDYINAQGGFARAINPQNEDEVFKEIHEYFSDIKVDYKSFCLSYEKTLT